MKRICAILVFCVMISGFGVTSAAEDGAAKTSKMLDAVKCVYNYDFEQKKETVLSSDNPVVLCNEYSDISMQKTDYKQPAFFKYDISEFAGKEVRKAEIVWGSTNRKSTALFDVSVADFDGLYEKRENNEAVERIKIGAQASEKISVGGNATEAPDLSAADYPGILSGYNINIDITEYIIDKVDSGNTEVALMWATNWGGNMVGKKDLAKLHIEYENNVKPQINFDFEDGKIVTAGSPLSLSAIVADTDGTIAECKFIFDTDEFTASNIGGNVYSVTVPAEKMTVGNHTIRITAKDDKGAEISVERSMQSYEPNTRYSTVTACEKIVNLDFSDGKKQGGNDIVLNVVQADDQKTKYRQPAFFKYDISEYAKYDLSSVQLVWGGKNPKPYNVYDVPGNDLTLTYTGEIPNRIAVGDLISSVKYNEGAESPALKGYPGIPSGYNMIFDLTSYVNKKLSAGETSFSIMFFDSWGGTATMDGREAQLWIKYNPNIKPTISWTEPVASAVLPGKDLNVTVNVKDEDGNVAEVTLTFGEKEYLLSKDGDVYSAVIPGADVSEGEHTVRITAKDNNGAAATALKKIYAASYRINTRSFTDENGGALNASSLKAGQTVKANANVSCAVPEGKNIVIMIALYDNNNTMKAFGFEKRTLAAGSTEDMSAQLKVPDDIDLNKTRIKSYITNGFRSMEILDSGAVMSD